jgi:hypothetical protein
MGYLVTFTPCGHEQHYNGAPAAGVWSSCWGIPGQRPGCQTQRKVKSVRDCPTCGGCIPGFECGRVGGAA